MHERDILLAALEKARPEEREAYLAEVCGADDQLRSRLDALLRASEVQDSFLEHPALETQVFAPEPHASRQNQAHEELSLDFLHPTDDAEALGRMGPYTITEVIGRGGMGVVLKARDAKLNRIVALKVLAPELATNPTARKRFQREAHAAAAVVHQHIVTIHAVDEDRLPYLVMECIVGQSLKEKIDHEGQLQIVEILRIGQQVASGLAAAHAHGLIHRDVKPANILLENGIERVRITDFGLARAVDDVGVTRTGEVAGTPQYMSPEQAQGLPMDARSDLFSLGCVLYAMCTGRPPFRADTAFATARRVCEDTPRPIREVNPEIPQWLTDIIERLLQKAPAQRFQSAKEVAELLGQYLAHAQQPAIVSLPGREPVSIKRNPGVPRRQWPVALIALLLVLVLALGLSEAAGTTQVVPTVIRIVRGEGALAIEVADPTVQVSLDGKELRIRGAGLQEFRLLPGNHHLHATKDGQPIKDEIVTITRDGRKVVTITREPPSGPTSSSVTPAVAEAVDDLTLLTKLQGHNSILHAVSFVPDGERMVSVDQGTVVRTWDLETFSVLSTLDLKGGYCSAADVSADGRFVAIITASAEKSRTIRVWDLQNRTQICEVTQQNVDYLAFIRFSPDGTRVVTSGKPSTGILWDVVTGKEVQRFELEERQTFAVAFSPNGRLLAMGAYGRVRLFDVESGDVLGDAHLPERHAVISLAFTPGGDSLACGQVYGHTSVIDVNSRKLTASLSNDKSRSHVVSARFIDNARLLLTRLHGEFEVWDVVQRKIVTNAASESGTTKRLALSPNGHYALSAHGEGWDDKSRSSTPNSDYALRLWQLPESVWPKQETIASSTVEQPTVNRVPGTSSVEDQELKTNPTRAAP